MTRDTDVLPLGAKPKYDLDAGVTVFIMTPERVIEPHVRTAENLFIDVPLFTLTEQEQAVIEARFETEVKPKRLRTVDGGNGFYGFMGFNWLSGHGARWCKMRAWFDPSTRSLR